MKLLIIICLFAFASSAQAQPICSGAAPDKQAACTAHYQRNQQAALERQTRKDDQRNKALATVHREQAKAKANNPSVFQQRGKRRGIKY